MQPYVELNLIDKEFSANRKRASLSGGDKRQLTEIFLLQTGLFSGVDLTVAPSTTSQWQQNQAGSGFADLPVTLGFQLTEEGKSYPKMKASIEELFPTGKFKNLSQNGLALKGLGEGSYQTKVRLILSKLFYPSLKHPLSLRHSFSYTLPTKVPVQEYNVYGGAAGTKGTVRPGKTFTTSLGAELSLTQYSSLACDLTYQTQGKSPFQGTLGTNAITGSPSNDSLKIAPAFEYNLSKDLGLIGGGQFTLYGRNTPRVISFQLSLVYNWTFMP